MLTEDQIKFLNSVCPYRWTETDGVINVNGSININNRNLTRIPVQYGQVTGYFDCSFNKLTNLIGAPSIVEQYFECKNNQLTSLKEGPKIVGWAYLCSNNKLRNLIGSPAICNESFNCHHNMLTSLEGCPSIIKFYLNCSNNPDLEYLWGIGRVEGEVYYDNHNDEINVWIIACMRRGIIFPYFTLEENIKWIKREQKYSCLLGAPEEIRKYFSHRIVHLADSGAYNESRILDYKKFKKLC